VELRCSSRLLGGSLHLDSSQCHGSTFTVKIPELYNPAAVPPREARKSIHLDPVVQRALAIPSAPVASSQRDDNDRDMLTNTQRILLVVEDDEIFAEILRDLSRELGLQSLEGDVVLTVLEAAYLLTTRPDEDAHAVVEHTVLRLPVLVAPSVGSGRGSLRRLYLGCP
jgi:hypothetical protein